MMYAIEKRCRECRSWTPDQGGRFGSCTSIAKRKSFMGADLDELVFTGSAWDKTVVKVGCAFGCVHWRPKLDQTDAAGERLGVTGERLREILRDNDMRPIDLAARLDVQPQRVSDWLTGHRKVPKMAVTLMKLKGLI